MLFVCSWDQNNVSYGRRPSSEIQRQTFLVNTMNGSKWKWWKQQQARVVRKVDNAIHRINHYPADSVVCFVNTCLLDSALSGG